MKRATIGALLLVALGALAVVGYSLARPWLDERAQRRSSDAADIDLEIRLAGDNYLGYWFLTSPEMRKQAARKGIAIQFTDDGGAYAERLQKFAAGEYDAIVLPVNSYLQHGASHDFPGVIVASIAESRGADGIVGYADRLPSGKVADLNDGELKIAYTAASPSEFLLDLTIADFDLDELDAGDRWRVEADGSRDVYRMAKNNEADVFVLWEPDLSRVLELPGLQYVWGSDRFAGYIIDVIVFRRDFLSDEGTKITDFLGTYFRVLSGYANGRDRMLEEMRQTTDLKADVLEATIDKIEWFDLEENRALQFGISLRADERTADGIVNSILSCTDVLLRTGRLDSDPLEGNPYLITNSTVIEELARSTPLQAGSSSVQTVSFEDLEAGEWERLREVGTFRVEPITFQSWGNQLTDEGKASVDRIAQLLVTHYPNYRFVIRGHTGPGGDEDENTKLSQQRAEVVAQYLKAVHDLPATRLLAEGLGSSQPPRRKPGESPRAYRYRLARVELTAVEANPL